MKQSMERKILAYTASKCTGCRYCETACSIRHKGSCGPSGALIRIVADSKALVNTALFCHLCKRPVCVELCPVNAIARNEETGIVSIDSDKCIGCGLCLECPLGGIVMDIDTGLAINCDLCDGNPACVEYCPTAALRYVLPARVRSNKRAGV